MADVRQTLLEAARALERAGVPDPRLDAEWLLAHVLGFVFGLWHPGWLLFLTIPIHYMHFDSQWERFTNPVVVTLIYLVLGCFFGLWHPGWLVFLAIPLGEMYKG